MLTTLDHPRLIRLGFDAAPDAIWAGLARHGRPIQYAHVAQPLALWDVWTAFAGPPVAFEAPSAGFSLDWKTLSAMRAPTIEFATLTHAAGISSTGDDALEHAARPDGRVHEGCGLADQRIGPATRLRVVDAILSGVHEAGTSHYQLLRAFTDDATLDRMLEAMDAHDFRGHEFGDSVFIEAHVTRRPARRRPTSPRLPA